MRTIKKGATSQSIYVEVLDSTSTTGGRKTGLAYNTASLTAYYVRNQGSATAITLATLAAANSAWSSGGFKEVDATNMPGIYRLDVPDAAFASGADDVSITIKGATGMAQVSLNVPLVDNLAADVYSRLGAPAGASVSADVAAVKTQTAAIETDTQDIQSRIPAALVSGRIDASIGAAAANTLTASALATDAVTEIQSGLATSSALSTVAGYIDTEVAAIKAKTDNLPTDPADASDISSAFGTVNSTLATIAGYLDTEIAAIKAKTDTLPTDPADASVVAGLIAAVETKVDTIDTVVDAIKVTTDRLDDTLEDDGGTFRFTTNALEQAPTGGSAPSAAVVAAAVWDEPISGHLTAGSTGNALNAAGSAGDPWSTPLPGAYGSGTAGKIVGDNINATISSRASQTSVDDVPTNAELATALGAADDAVLAQVALVKAKTDNLPSDPADASDITGAFATVNATLATIAAYIDTEVAAIKAKTDSLTFTVAGQVDANIQYVNDVQVTGNGQTGTEWGPA